MVNILIQVTLVETALHCTLGQSVRTTFNDFHTMLLMTCKMGGLQLFLSSLDGAIDENVRLGEEQGKSCVGGGDVGERGRMLGRGGGCWGEGEDVGEREPVGERKPGDTEMKNTCTNVYTLMSTIYPNWETLLS